jgi:gamma-glutamyltranspeptidase/glutathione hydrolase
MRRSFISFVFIVTSLLIVSCEGSRRVPTLASRIPAAWPYTSHEAVAGAPGAMVVTDAALATDVGVQVLEAGGNAIDAAVATAFALAVVYPEAGNLGGGGFLVARMADGTEAALDFREKAPLAATRDMFLDSAGNPTDRSLIGHLASGVPGSVAGLWEAHRRFGSRPWRELLEPAIRLARDGFTVDARFAAIVQEHAPRLQRFTGSAALFLPGGQPLPAGTQWKNPDLAVVLERIAEHGTQGFYEGETADLLVAEMKKGGGLTTHADLKRYQAKWRDPVAFEYRGHRIISMPPPSSGGLTLALILGILEGFPLAPAGPRDPRARHFAAEAMRRAFADRNYFLGDPDFVRVPTAQFLSRDYAAQLRASIDTSHATPSDSVRPGGITAREGNHTTHFAVVDAAGNAVALTTTLNELFGSAVTVTGGGFLLNDEMDDFTSKVGAPNLFGLVQGEANAIVPEKRMLSAMTPTIVLSPDGRPLMLTGGRGGPRIITAVAQIITNVLDYRMTVEQAVNAPRIHHQHLPDILYFEKDGLTAADSAALTALGHNVQPRNGYIGNAPTIVRVNNEWRGMPDPRVGGKASGK